MRYAEWWDMGYKMAEQGEPHKELMKAIKGAQANEREEFWLGVTSFCIDQEGAEQMQEFNDR